MLGTAPRSGCQWVFIFELLNWSFLAFFSLRLIVVRTFILCCFYFALAFFPASTRGGAGPLWSGTDPRPWQLSHSISRIVLYLTRMTPVVLSKSGVSIKQKSLVIVFSFPHRSSERPFQEISKNKEEGKGEIWKWWTEDLVRRWHLWIEKGGQGFLIYGLDSPERQWNCRYCGNMNIRLIYELKSRKC